MNSWSNENYQMGMAMMPPLVPPMCMMDNVNGSSRPSAVAPLIGPVMPDNFNQESQDAAIEADSQANDVSSSQNKGKRSRSRDRSGRRDRDRNNTVDRGRRRSRSRDRYDRDRRDRSRNRKRDINRERKSKWDDNEKDSTMLAQQNIGGMNMGNMMMQGMMQYPNMMNMMGQQTIDGQVPMMSGMNMMNNMMQPMMDQNMMMMNQQMMPMMANQQICTTDGVLLPPIPGVSTPARRERPKGCRTIFVGGLPHTIKDDTLNELFQKFGSVVEVKSPRNGVFYVRFATEESVEQSFYMSGYRYRFHDQMDNEATTMFIDYALNREDQTEYERNQRKRESTPPRLEPFTPTALSTITEKIKSEEEFSTAAPTLAAWLERGECNKKNANTFYSLVQASNNQVRRLFNDKMQLDDELQNMKTTIRDKFSQVIKQFEQVAKILSAARHQRVSDHFNKQQRRNIEMWLKMTEELENLKEEFIVNFDEDEAERPGKNMVAQEKYDALKKENENLNYELEGYKNEAYLAQNEAERKFEKFKAHYIAQQALQNKQGYTPVPQITAKTESSNRDYKPLPPPPLPPPPPPPAIDDDKVITSGPEVPPTEAKLISILTAFLMVHPLGASLDYLVSYVRSMTPSVTQATVLAILQKYTDVFRCKTSGVGASIEHRWGFVTFDIIKIEQ